MARVHMSKNNCTAVNDLPANDREVCAQLHSRLQTDFAKHMRKLIYDNQSARLAPMDQAWVNTNDGTYVVPLVEVTKITAQHASAEASRFSADIEISPKQMLLFVPLPTSVGRRMGAFLVDVIGFLLLAVVLAGLISPRLRALLTVTFCAYVAPTINLSC